MHESYPPSPLSKGGSPACREAGRGFGNNLTESFRVVKWKGLKKFGVRGREFGVKELKGTVRVRLDKSQKCK